jgi:hypothetical protein
LASVSYLTLFGHQISDQNVFRGRLSDLSVRGRNVHNNSIESFWALLKRGILGTYHQLGKIYLPLYLRMLDGGVCCELLSDQDTAVYAMGWFINIGR